MSKKMRKLDDIINSCYDDGLNIMRAKTGINITLSDLEDIDYNHKYLIFHKYTETLCKNTMEVFKNLGFKIQPYSIGWKIYR